MAKLKLEGQLDVVEYSRVTVPESVNMGDLAGGLCGDVESEELRERAPDGLEREASHAGISEKAYGEF